MILSEKIQQAKIRIKDLKKLIEEWESQEERKTHIKQRINTGSMFNSMGHSLECHLREYPFATTSTTASTFKRARKLIIK